MEVQAPENLKQPLVVPQKILMGPGPSNCSPRVLFAVGQPVIGHMHQETFKIMDEIKEGLKYVFQTKNELTLALSTSGHGGMEAVLCNLVEPGDKVLIAANGLWGSRAADMAKRYGGDVSVLWANLGDNFTLRQLEASLRTTRPKVLFIVQGESSSGVYQPLEGAGTLCHRYNCLLVVDCVASLGGTPMFVDHWGIDAIYSGSQKVLGAPPGLTPISFSPRAQQVIFNRKTPVPVFYLDMKEVGQQWNCFNNARPYHHTTCSNLLCGLREGLAQIVEEGLGNVIKRHYECAQRLYTGLRRLGLEPFIEDQNKRLPTVTTIRVPENVDWREIIAYAMKNYNLEISGGLGPSAGKVLRIGLMGYNATRQKVDFVLKVLGEGLDSARNKTNSKL